MRAILGVIGGVLGLLMVLAWVGVLAKKQLAATGQTAPALTMPVAGDESPTSQPGANVQAPSQQIQQQYQQALEGALQQARPMAEEKP